MKDSKHIRGPLQRAFGNSHGSHALRLFYRSAFLLVVLVVLATTGVAGRRLDQNLGRGTNKVTICLEKGTDAAVVIQAQTIAARMFSRIGVETEWHGYEECRGRCDKPILIQITTGTAEINRPGVLAYTRHSEGRIQVFYDRVHSAAAFSRLPDVLAHVLVHEITHVIEGSDRHADVGIMKAHWNSMDYRQMMRSPLTFTQEHLKLIHNGLAARLQAQRQCREE